MHSLNSASTFWVRRLEPHSLRANTLVLSINWATSSGRVAMDTDRLVFRVQ